MATPIAIVAWVLRIPKLTSFYIIYNNFIKISFELYIISAMLY